MKVERKWIGWFTIPIPSIFVRDYYQQYTNFLTLSNKESVIVNPAITAHTLRKKGVVKPPRPLFPLMQSEFAEWLK